MHIAIEGLDGVGKTTVAREVASRLGFCFIEKPLHLVLDSEGMDCYLRATAVINQRMDGNFKTLFYGAGNYLVSQLAKEKNIVTDRHLVSNYYCNSEQNDLLFDQLVNYCGIPDLTVILFASPEVRRDRILHRNPNDPDLLTKTVNNDGYQKMQYFLKKYQMPFHLIDTTSLDIDRVVETIIYYIKYGNKNI